MKINTAHKPTLYIFSGLPGSGKSTLAINLSQYNKASYLRIDTIEQALKDEAFFKKITSSKIPVLLLLNKIDRSNQEQLEAQVQLWSEKVPNAEIFPVSALMA